MWGAIASAGANIAGSLISAKGQRDTNKANARLAKENRDWQEKMSNTAYQRSAIDLQQAGLNRILALGSPASTPAGNVATMQNDKKAVGEAVGKGVSNALQAKIMNAQLDNLRATEQHINAQTAKTLSDKESTDQNIKIKSAAGAGGDFIGQGVKNITDVFSPQSMRKFGHWLGGEGKQKVQKAIDATTSTAKQVKQGITEIPDEVMQALQQKIEEDRKRAKNTFEATKKGDKRSKRAGGKINYRRNK